MSWTVPKVAVLVGGKQAAMKDKAASALYEFNNQYPPYGGVPELKQAVARHSERYTGIAVDAATETLVTVGASEALTCAFLGLVNRGDEVILFDPQASHLSSLHWVMSSVDQHALHYLK